jgi:hypothetical protein
MDALVGTGGSGTGIQQTSAGAARLVRLEQAGLVRQAAQAGAYLDVDDVVVSGAQAPTPATGGAGLQVAPTAGGGIDGTRAADDAARKAFFGMLINNGVCPVQLYEDLMVSLMDWKDEEIDRGKVFQGVGPGLTVDTTA